MNKTIEQLDAEVADAAKATSEAAADWSLCVAFHPDDNKRISHACRQWTERLEWLKTVMAAKDALKQAQQNG